MPRNHIFVWMGTTILLVGCSTVRLEQTSGVEPGLSSSTRIVSYFDPRDEVEAKEMMAKVCAPASVQIVAVTERRIGRTLIHGQRKELSRTFIRFECR